MQRVIEIDARQDREDVGLQHGDQQFEAGQRHDEGESGYSRVDDWRHPLLEYQHDLHELGRYGSIERGDVQEGGGGYGYCNEPERCEHSDDRGQSPQ